MTPLLELQHNMADKAGSKQVSAKLGDRREPQRVGAKITPTMVEAGVEVFLASYPDSGAGDALDRRMVASIFTEMVAASGVAPHRVSVD